MESFDTIVKTNLYGLLHCTQAALPALKASRGIIVNISSGLAMRALPFLTAYAGTKSMVNALSEGMRLELAPYGIRVLNFCPPMTDTGFDTSSIKGPGLENADFAGMKSAKTARVAAEIDSAIRREKARSGGGFFKLMNAVAPRALDRMFAGMATRLGKRAGMYTDEVTRRGSGFQRG
jgi:short-subunit dehydrogenase